MSDIFPTGYFGAQLAEVRAGDTVAVFGAGPVGQFAIASAKLMGAGRVIAIDRVASRLEMACAQGRGDRRFRGGRSGRDGAAADGRNRRRSRDRRGGRRRDARDARAGPADRDAAHAFDAEVEAIAPHRKPDGRNWVPGDGPSQVLQWAVRAVAKAGTVAVIGVYPPASRVFPVGDAMNRNLTIKMGSCNHRTVTPPLVEPCAAHSTPLSVLTRCEPLTNAIDAYRAFDTREPGWMKVKLTP